MADYLVWDQEVSGSSPDYSTRGSSLVRDEWSLTPLPRVIGKVGRVEMQRFAKPYINKMVRWFGSNTFRIK